jgi:Holliday junction DNA helicase RuvB
MEITRLADYVGQEQIKKRITVAIKSSLIRKTAFPHTLLAGPAGLGKSSLCKVIANECGCPFFSYLATNIDGEKQIEAIFSKIPKIGYDLKTGEVVDRDQILPVVIFIDEIHNLKRKTIEMLHTVLENNRITIKRKNYITGMVEPTLCWVPEFCLMGATNYFGSLPKPFRDRFQLNLLFETYTNNEIFTVLKNLAAKREIKMLDDAILGIADKSRGVPRVAISLFNKAYDVSVAFGEPDKITKEHVETMLEYEEIDNMGLTRMDRKALNYLATVPRPIGLKAFAQALDEDVQTVENVIEPYLVRIGFIVRTGAGRYLTEEGKNHIQREREMSLYPVQV